MRRLVVPFMLFTLGSLATAGEDAGPWKASERAIAEAPVGTVVSTLVSDDGTHTSFVVKRGESMVAVVDGKESAAYDSVTPHAAHGGRRAFIASAERAKASYVVLAHEEKGPFERIEE